MKGDADATVRCTRCRKVLEGEGNLSRHSAVFKTGQLTTDLKHVPLEDMCHPGGWKDSYTILACYQQPDEETLRAALEQRGSVQAVVAI